MSKTKEKLSDEKAAAFLENVLLAGRNATTLDDGKTEEKSGNKKAAEKVFGGRSAATLDDDRKKEILDILKDKEVWVNLSQPEANVNWYSAYKKIDGSPVQLVLFIDRQNSSMYMWNKYSVRMYNQKTQSESYSIDRIELDPNMQEILNEIKKKQGAFESAKRNVENLAKDPVIRDYMAQYLKQQQGKN